MRRIDKVIGWMSVYTFFLFMAMLNQGFGAYALVEMVLGFSAMLVVNERMEMDLKNASFATGDN